MGQYNGTLDQHQTGIKPLNNKHETLSRIGLNVSCFLSLAFTITLFYRISQFISLHVMTNDGIE